MAPQILPEVRDERIHGRFDDTATWQARRELWEGVPSESAACRLECDRCTVGHQPALLFIDVTNHCNMECPICGFSLRGMRL